MTEDEKALVVFRGKGIRRIWHDEEWQFSIGDVIEVLTGMKGLNRTIKSYS